MTTAQAPNTPQTLPLRLWPGVVIVTIQWLVRFVLPKVHPDGIIVAVLGGLLGGVLILLWWAFFSRAPHVERWGAILLIVLGLAGTSFLLHESLATAGMGMLFFIYATPVVSLALVAWAALSRNAGAKTRRLTMALSIFLACGSWALLKTGGITGNNDADFSWRWSKSPEEKLLAQNDLPSAVRPPVAAGTEAQWPGFRGPSRDGVIRGVQIETDWSSSPPVELWRREIGPGWSSFAVRGDFIYTQEQRGEEEMVAAYHARTGEPIWRHSDTTRFWESNAGAGPRATPTVQDGRVYSFGATGILNVLDADSGRKIWSTDVATDAKTDVPGWGFSSSPLVADDLVLVAAAGTLAAYESATGEPRWFGEKSGGYSSPHYVQLDGVPQILLQNRVGLVSFAPDDGRVLWQHEWPGEPIVQPALTSDGDVLMTTVGAASGLGMRRLDVSQSGTTADQSAWSIKELWTSNRLKPYFNDFVIHEGHVYGFDNSIMACIDMADGQRKWKGGRYGHGQLLLLAAQDLMLVLSEEGDLVLVSATPDGFEELAKVPAIEGKTWNHPVLVDDLLLVRNGEEMMAFKLALAST